MISPKLVIKILTLLGLVAGLMGAVKLARAIKPGRRTILPPDIEKDRRVTLEGLLEGDIYKTGIRLIFLGFVSQFFAVFCQLFYY